MREPNLADVIRTCPHLSESVHRTEQRREEKNRKEEGKGYSPNPEAVRSPALADEVYSILDSGIASIDHNDHGRPWPYPNRAAIARLTAEFDPDLCAEAAREAKEIVQAQDRAPNISALFEKKLRDLAAEADHRTEVRDAVRESLGGAA